MFTLPRFTYLKNYAADATIAPPMSGHFTIVADGVEYDGVIDRITGKLSGVMYWDKEEGWQEVDEADLEFEILPTFRHCDQCEELTLCTVEMFHYSFIASYLCKSCAEMEAAHLI